MAPVMAARVGVRRNVLRAFDTFTRADNAASLGTAESGQTWTALVGTWGVLSSQAYSATGVDGDFASLDVGVTDIDVSVQFGAINNTAYYGLCARLTDTSNFYRAEFGGGNGIVIHKVVAGTVTSLGSAAASNVANTVVRLRVVGTQLSAYVNGALLVSATDSQITSGTKLGLRRGSAGTTPTMTFDNLTVTTP